MHSTELWFKRISELGLIKTEMFAIGHITTQGLEGRTTISMVSVLGKKSYSGHILNCPRIIMSGVFAPRRRAIALDFLQANKLNF